MENDTQVCDLSWNRTQELDESAGDKENNPVAVFAIKEQRLLIYPGNQYVIGRGNGVSLQVRAKTLSKQHVQIEYEGGSHLITDLGSRNKTKRGGLLLRPNVVYELPDRAELLLGDTKATYNYIHENAANNFLGVTAGRLPNCSTPAKTVRIQDEVQALEISADGESSDVEAVPPSQFLPNLDESSLLYVEDSPQNSPLKTHKTLGQQVPETPGAVRVTSRQLQLDQSEELGKDTSLINTLKELNTLAQLQGKDLTTTIPDSQLPNFTLEDADEQSDCGSEIVDLNNQCDEPEKIAETQDARESRSEGEDSNVGMGDEMNTQCWDITIPPDEEEEEKKKKNEVTDKIEDTEVEKVGDSTDKDTSLEECDTTADTATASEDEDDPLQDDQATTSDLISGTGEKSGSEEQTKEVGLTDKTQDIDNSDMEITCLDQRGEISMLSEGLAGGFSPTSAPATEIEGDSDATDIEEDIPVIPARPGHLPASNRRSTNLQESLIEPPAMSESELENSIDRRDKYRRSLMNSMAEDSQMWASVMSTKTSSTASNSNSQGDPEKTPPREDFMEDIARTPPRSVTERPNTNPVTTPTKILEVKSQIQMIEMSDEVVEGDFVETQEVPNITIEEKDENTYDEVGKSANGSTNNKSDNTKEVTTKPSVCAKGSAVDEMDTEDEEDGIEEGDDKQFMPELRLDDEPVLLIDNSDDMKATEDDDETDCEIDDDDEMTNKGREGGITEVVKDDDEDDELQITSVQEACSLVITHVMDVEDTSEVSEVQVNEVSEAPVTEVNEVPTAAVDDVSISEVEDVPIATVDDVPDPELIEEDTPCTLELDVRLIGGTDGFDVKIKGEPNSQEKASKSFMSMFDSDEEDGPVYDSQLNTLPAGDYVAQSFDLISPVKKKEPLNKKGAGRGRKPRATKPKAVPNRKKHNPFDYESEEDQEEDIPKGRSLHKNSAAKKEGEGTESGLTAEDSKPAKKEEKSTHRTVLKLESVEELLRKRREVKQRLDAKETNKAHKTQNKGKNKKSTKVLDDEDDLPEFGLMDDASDDSDEVIELDLITSCRKPKIVPVQIPVLKQEPQQDSNITPCEQGKVTGSSRKRKPVQSLPNNPKKDKLSLPLTDLDNAKRTTKLPPASLKQKVAARKQKRPLSDSEGDSSGVSRRSARRGNDDSDDTQDSMKSNQSIARSTRRGNKNKIIETESDDGELSLKAESEIPTTKKKTVAAKRGRKKQNTAPDITDDEEARSQSPDPQPTLSTPVKRQTNRASRSSPAVSLKMECSPAPSTRRRTNPSDSIEGSPAPISKRGRRRKVNSDVKEFLKEAKKELETKIGRAKGGAKVKEEMVVEEDQENVAVKVEPKKRGGRNTKKPGVKQEFDVSPEPLITVGRGKRKKTSGSTVKEEAQSPSAAIINKSYKQGDPHLAPPPRSTTINKRVEIVYTGITPDSASKKSIAALDGFISSDISTCTHLVTDKIKRTSKFLCAIGRGIPIVSENWLKESKKSKTFLDAADFFIKDKETEKKYKFVLTQSLTNARTCPFLSGKSVFVTKSCEPTPEQFQPIISCNGGTMLKRAPKASDRNVIIIAASDDKLTTLKKCGAPICTPELVLTGALRQELCIDEFSLREKSPDF
ncbi:mediator of DNA damage checkpoint protein 1-like isoform X4 [Bolinopsis microptera]|uniref:mediator of DNA damage checkpoint protein 1-like isoform X4 n=1 Tax=Bolinopsis microptera TaxID=2820187 RepID=UPI00307A7B31